MPYLVETSPLMRIANVNDANHLVAKQAVTTLRQRGELLHIAPQSLIEFRNAATRPVAVNGLGMTIAEEERQATIFEASFDLLEETPAIFPAWKKLVTAAGVVGRQVHDARLVAVCHVCGLTHILTHDVQHYTRFASYGPGIIVVHPADV